MSPSLPIPPQRIDDRVVLRPWRSDRRDVAALLTGARDPEVRRFRGSMPDDADESWADEWIASVAADRERGTRLELAVGVPNDTATAIGSVTLWDIHHRNRDAMVSWWLAPAGRGHGLGTAAVRRLADWAFTELRLARLGAFVEPDNRASLALAHRVGFVEEGRLRAHVRRRDGHRSDSLMLGLLPEDLAAV